jgi:hypothetical protein
MEFCDILLQWFFIKNTMLRFILFVEFNLLKPPVIYMKCLSDMRFNVGRRQFDTSHESRLTVNGSHFFLSKENYMLINLQ